MKAKMPQTAPDEVALGQSDGNTDSHPPGKGPSSSMVEAERILAEPGSQEVLKVGALLLDDRESAASQAARVLDEILLRRPEALVPIIERLIVAVGSTQTRVVNTASSALPVLARVAPARVSRHLDRLVDSFGNTTDIGKDGLVRTFISLCLASIAYQKRLEPALARALQEADPKTLAKWTELVLPALKGEPHAHARTVVEERLATLPRPVAQRIAGFLGVKLRPAR